MPSKGVMKIYRSSYKTYPNLLRTIARRLSITNGDGEDREAGRGRKDFCAQTADEDCVKVGAECRYFTDFYNHGYNYSEKVSQPVGIFAERRIEIREQGCLEWFPNRRKYILRQPCFGILSIQVCWRAIHIFYLRNSAFKQKKFTLIVYRNFFLKGR